MIYCKKVIRKSQYLAELMFYSRQQPGFSGGKILWEKK